MEPFDFIFLFISVSTLIVSLVTLFLVLRTRAGADVKETERRLSEEIRAARQEIQSQNRQALEAFSRSFREQEEQVFLRQDKRLSDLTQSLQTSLETLRATLDSVGKATDARMSEMAKLQAENQETLRKTVDEKLTEIRQGNEKNLGEIRASVEEKLQSTLEERISRSFKEVSDRLAEVYKGLGEMQTLASGVGDLKRVLSNVKTRGILGEIQLGSILEEILSPEQYETDIATVPGSANRVEFAVKLPGGEDGGVVYLPIDSKFPMDAYLALQDAYDAGNADEIKSSRKELESRIKSFAKDIQTKYVSVPHTTEFAIMFLPTEGLYAEVVKMGMIEVLQQSYRINVAGPTTMAALLNSLQTGFRTLAIQKRSSEVWEVLGAVRTEFDKFADVIGSIQKRLDMANRDLDDLVGKRTNAIRRKLKNVSTLPAARAEALLEEGEDGKE